MRETKQSASLSRQEIDSTAIELTEIFVDLVNRKLMATAFCIDLARTALGWELAGDQAKARKAIKKAFDRSGDLI